MDKVLASAAQAVALVPDGATIMMGGFGVCGLPEKPFRHHGPATIGHADEENVAHSGCAIVANYY